MGAKPGRDPDSLKTIPDLVLQQSAGRGTGQLYKEAATIKMSMQYNLQECCGC